MEQEPAAGLAERLRAQIRLEEIFRHELRRELEAKELAKPGWRHRLWAFLNSSFGLWFLSAVLVSSLVGAYTRHETRSAQERESRRQVERIDREIAFRLSRIFGMLAVAAKTGFPLDAKHLDELIQRWPSDTSEDKLSYELVQRFGRTRSLFLEFQEHSLLALLSELTRHSDFLLKTVTSRPVVRATGPAFAFTLPHGQIEHILERLSDAGTLYEAEKLSGDPTELARFLNEEVLLDRWRWLGFNYLDCEADMPFC